MSEKRKVQYVWSHREERYSSDEHDSREAALAEAREECPGERIFTGRVVNVDPTSVTPEGHWITEMMGEHLFDLVG